MMRTFLLSLAAAATVASLATFAAPRADAMTAGTASGVLAAIQSGQTLQDVALVCRHRVFTSRQRCRPVLTCRHRFYTSRRVCW